MAKINIHAFKDFFKSTSTSTILIFSGVIVSLVIANSPLAGAFQRLLDTQLGIHTNNIHLRYPIQLWINDGLMAIFFLMVGLEIKREVVEGELSTPKKALLPILCAFGGAVTPAIIYTLLNAKQTTASGWGIPIATDIAFALAIIAMLGKRVPASLKIFLAALAIVDDLMAILVIAIFYASELHTDYLVYSAAIIALLFIFNRLKLTKLGFYLVPGVLLWYFIHHSGVHATIAGVITALFLPTTQTAKESPLEKLEHLLTKPVNYLIVPLFAIANTNITFHNEMLGGLFTPLGLGIILGLIIGKPVGVFITSWVAVKLGLCHLPEKANWQHIIGVGMLAGIGFTMSIFMALLSFTDATFISQAKFSVLVGSILSGTLGYILLSRTKLHNSRTNS
jgi:NhaA family Na+:H+ antiporter